MIEEKVYMKEIEKLMDNDVYSVSIKTVSVGDESNDYYSLINQDIHVHINENGGIYMSDWESDSSGVSFSPQALKYLREILNIAETQADNQK